MARPLLRIAALGYLALLLLAPVGMIAYRTFAHGLTPVWHALSTPTAVHALLMSLAVTAVAVPINVVFGTGAGPMQTFWRITLPSIRWALVYGVVLSVARALGE